MLQGGKDRTTISTVDTFTTEQRNYVDCSRRLSLCLTNTIDLTLSGFQTKSALGIQVWEQLTAKYQLI